MLTIQAIPVRLVIELSLVVSHFLLNCYHRQNVEMLSAYCLALPVDHNQSNDQFNDQESCNNAKDPFIYLLFVDDERIDAESQSRDGPQ